MAGASMMMMPIMSGTGSLTVAITQRDRPIVAVAAFLALIGSIAIGAMMMISQRSGVKRQVREAGSATWTTSRPCGTPCATRSAGQRAEQTWRHPRTDELLDVARDPRAAGSAVSDTPTSSTSASAPGRSRSRQASRSTSTPAR